MKLFLFSILAFFAFAVHAKTIEVCPNCEIKTIKKAVEVATNGDIILVKKGVYKENNITIIDKSIQIIGENNPIIDGELAGTVFSIRSNNFSIEGLTILNVGNSYTKDFAGMVISQSKEFTIKNNTLENVFFGILIEKSSFGKIENNTISSLAKQEANSGNGIHLWHSNHLTISGNHVSQMRDGIYIEFGDSCIIKNNRSSNNIRYGLHFMFSNYNKYSNNVFDNNGAGVAVMFSKFITMTGNLFKKSWGNASYGLLLKEIYDSELKNNIFENNTIGINADGATRVKYVKNDFISNGYAIKIQGGCYNNTFTENNFLHNAFDVSYHGAINENIFHKNYWASYTGYDLDKNNLGDVPHRPVKLFSYLVNKSPESIVLLRSLFIDIINFSEKVSPIFTPADLIDKTPKMTRIIW
jgi:nitrous oxidase accessory protein